jgi:sphingolipid delta-4 desaturase
VSWHARRHRTILRDHPRVRELFGADASSAAWIVLLAALQIALAFWAARRPLWASVTISVTAGAVIAHALGVLIHEASHNLIFKRTWKNKLVAIAANLPLGAPAAIAFRHQHMLHHKYLGESGDPDGRDTQAPTRQEVQAVGHSSLRKLLSFTFGRFVYPQRPANAVPRDAWFLGNAVACLLTDVAIVAVAGLRPLAFLVLSALLAFGPHVLGARRVSEHLTIRRGQPTNSYYGPLNRVSFDVGYHVEHHDFPAVPWRRLRGVHAMAHDHYDGLAAVPSWAQLMAAYVFDRRYSVAQYTGLSEEYLEEPRSWQGAGLVLARGRAALHRTDRATKPPSAA